MSVLYCIVLEVDLFITWISDIKESLKNVGMENQVFCAKTKIIISTICVRKFAGVTRKRHRNKFLDRFIDL